MKPKLPDDFLLRRYVVSVRGYPDAKILAASRGKALSRAWRNDVFTQYSFGEFMKMATARLCREEEEPDFAQPITVMGKPAYYVTRDNQYVYFAYPGEEHLWHAHPSDVLPEQFRPLKYRTDVPPIPVMKRGAKAVGTGIDLCDMHGVPVHVGDVLRFDTREWGKPHVFRVELSQGQILISGAPSDIPSWCEVIERYDGVRVRD